MSTIIIPEDSDIYHKGCTKNCWLFTEKFLFEESEMLETRGAFKRLVYYSKRLSEPELGQRQ